MSFDKILQSIVDQGKGVLGAVLGLGIAQVAISAFNQALTSFPQGAPYWFAIELDTTVLLFVLLLTVGASLLSGVIPAILRCGLGGTTTGNHEIIDCRSALTVSNLSRRLPTTAKVRRIYPCWAIETLHASESSRIRPARRIIIF